MNADICCYIIIFMCGFLCGNDSNLAQHCLLLNQEDHTLQSYLQNTIVVFKTFVYIVEIKWHDDS